MPVKTSPYLALLGLSFILILAGCSPSLAPMYEDFEISSSIDGDVEQGDVQQRILTALEETGWVAAEESILPTVIMTEERTINRWGLYKTTAILEILPVGDNYVRVLIHPYRDHLIGFRAKMPYLPSSMHRQIVSDLSVSLEAQGLYTPGQVPAAE